MYANYNIKGGEQYGDRENIKNNFTSRFRYLSKQKEKFYKNLSI